MKLLLEIFLLCMLYELSIQICHFIPLSVPPALIGMGILFILLMSGFIKIKHFEQSSQFFTRHMILFFIPIMVGVMDYWGILEQGGWHLMVTIVVSTAIVLVLTSIVTTVFKKRRDSK